MNTVSCQNQCFLKGYKSDVTSPQNCKNFISHFIQLSEQRFILCLVKSALGVFCTTGCGVVL